MEIDRSELYRYLTRRYSYVDVEEVRDAVQSAIAATWERSVLREPPQNVQAYSTVVAQRMLMRQIEYRRRHLNPTGILQNGWDDVGYLGYSSITSRDAEASVDAQTVLNALPDRYANILRRHYLDGHTLEELAHNEGVTPECMRKRHERAIKCARKMFANEE